MNQRISILVVLLVLPIAWLLGAWLNKNTQQSSSDLPSEMFSFTDCVPWQSACSVTGKKYTLALRFSHQPVPLEPFDIQLSIKGVKPERISMEFEMVGMDMGFNQFEFHKDDERWSTTGMLPVCSLGRSDWLARLNVTTGSSILTTSIPFAVQGKTH